MTPWLKTVVLNDYPKCRSGPQMTQMNADVKNGMVMFNDYPKCRSARGSSRVLKCGSARVVKL